MASPTADKGELEVQSRNYERNRHEAHHDRHGGARDRRQPRQRFDQQDRSGRRGVSSRPEADVSGQGQREALLQRSVDASRQERRRIAGALHDRVVQDLVATSFRVTGSAERAESVGQPELAQQLRGAAGTGRTSIGGLRSLLVDIYPPICPPEGHLEARTGGRAR